MTSKTARENLKKIKMQTEANQNSKNKTLGLVLFPALRFLFYLRVRHFCIAFDVLLIPLWRDFVEAVL